MKNLKLSIAMLLISAAFSTKISAQAAEKKEAVQETPRQHFEENRARLEIKPEQQGAYKEISKRYAEELRDIRQSTLDKEQKMQKAKTLMDKKDQEMKGLLTAEQFKVYQQMQEERKIKMDERKKVQ